MSWASGGESPSAGSSGAQPPGVLLAADIGNADTVLGLLEPDGDDWAVTAHWRISTDEHRTADEWAVLLRGLLGERESEVSGIAGRSGLMRSRPTGSEFIRSGRSSDARSDWARSMAATSASTATRSTGPERPRSISSSR